MSKLRANKKIAVVTGGVRRLGRKIAYALGEDGYDLALVYNSSNAKEIKITSDELKRRGVRFKFYKCDVADTKQLKQTIDKIGREFKRIDVLINNAGVIRKIEFEKITPEIFDFFININVKAALFASQYGLKYLNKSKTPCIINLASLGGLQNWTGFIPYSVSKTGLIKLTTLLAKRLAPKIRINAIAPGTIVIDNEKAGTTGIISSEKIPLKKYGSAENITEAVRFILKNDYLTGQVITVDGGRIL